MQPSGRFIQPFLAVAQTANGQNKPDDLKCHQPQKKNENQQNSSHEFRFWNQIKPVHTKISFLCILQFCIPIAVDLLNLAGMRNGGIHDWLTWKIPECQAENAENGQHQLNCHQNRNYDFPAGFPFRRNGSVFRRRNRFLRFHFFRQLLHPVGEIILKKQKKQHDGKHRISGIAEIAAPEHQLVIVPFRFRHIFQKIRKSQFKIERFRHHAVLLFPSHISRSLPRERGRGALFRGAFACFSGSFP